MRKLMKVNKNYNKININKNGNKLKMNGNFMKFYIDP